MAWDSCFFGNRCCQSAIQDKYKNKNSRCFPFWTVKLMFVKTEKSLCEKKKHMNGSLFTKFDTIIIIYFTRINKCIGWALRLPYVRFGSNICLQLALGKSLGLIFNLRGDIATYPIPVSFGNIATALTIFGCNRGSIYCNSLMYAFHFQYVSDSTPISEYWYYRSLKRKDISLSQIPSFKQFYSNKLCVRKMTISKTKSAYFSLKTSQLNLRIALCMPRVIWPSIVKFTQR